MQYYAEAHEIPADYIELAQHDRELADLRVAQQDFLQFLHEPDFDNQEWVLSVYVGVSKAIGRRAHDIPRHWQDLSVSPSPNR